jgi:uncharacterized membrane protein YebE (DUF533 family)
MSTLAELKASVLEDGVIDAEEVTQIKETIYADGVIDREEADFMFELNDIVSGKENALEWKDLFASALCDYVTKDEKTPGVVDAEEAKYIVDKINDDGQVDDAEKALLTKIKAEATLIDPVLGKFIEEQGI